jgi:hypothetical protein
LQPGLVIQIIGDATIKTVDAAKAEPQELLRPFGPSSPDPEPVDPTVFKVPRGF